MNADLVSILQQWPIDVRDVALHPVASRSSFSGAEIWKAASAEKNFALRCWQARIDEARLRAIHQIQQQLSEHGPPIIPRLVTSRAGSTIVARGGRLWELSTWMPGAPDLSPAPPLARVQAALHALALVHNAAERHATRSWDESARFVRSMAANSPERGSRAMRGRRERLTNILQSELATVNRSLAAIDNPTERQVAEHATRLVATLAPAQRHLAAVYAVTRLPVQPRLGDARREHFLFTCERCTGVVDFGAVDVDSPAGDVGRLLGGFARGDSALWERGLAAYEQVHPLTDDEREAAKVFDSTGTVISAFNWVRWLYTRDGPRTAVADRDAGLARLRELVGRLEHLARQ